MTSKKQYDKDKKIRDLYHSNPNITEPYSYFKAKLRKTKNPI